MNEVFIVAAKRTPIGGFMGSLSGFSAPELGALAIRASIRATGLGPECIDSVYMGNVLSAGLGQSPARQASLFAGIPYSVDCTTVGKVCAASMKATMLAAQQIQLGLETMVIGGGMESMSNTPHYTYMRRGTQIGSHTVCDGLLKDGLTDVYRDTHMGNIAEMTVSAYGLSRSQQDEYALNSYTRAIKATELGKFRGEIEAVEIIRKNGSQMMEEDEDIYKVIPEKVAQLAPVFDSKGTITAANASNINDGAAAILVASSYAVRKFGLKPLAKIVSYADGALEPDRYALAPSVAIPRALSRAKLALKDMDIIEINEAYSAVVLANALELGLDLRKTNIYGGAIALGHPLGTSGARIICTLLSALREEGGKYGIAAICNGGGGASAVVVENLVF